MGGLSIIRFLALDSQGARGALQAAMNRAMDAGDVVAV